MSEETDHGASARRPSDVPNHGLVLYVVKASPTSTNNTVKALFLIEELGLQHEIYVVTNPGAQVWFKTEVNPEGMVPALEDDADQGNGSTKRINVFESSSCLTFLADKYDVDGLFSGKNLYERAQIGNWMTVHTAALGATAKWWLWFKVKHPDTAGVALDKLLDSIRSQYSLLEEQLARPGQGYIALPDRPSIADLATLPFANEMVAASAGMNFADWPHLKAWSEKMLGRPKVMLALQRVRTFGL